MLSEQAIGANLHAEDKETELYNLTDRDFDNLEYIPLEHQ